MNNRFTIQDIAALLSVRTGKSPQDAERFLREFISVVSDGVLSDRMVKVKGLGTFKVLLVEDRESIHVNTGERILIPSHYKYTFIPDTELKELVNRPFSIFETTEISDSDSFPDLEVTVGDEDESDNDEEVPSVFVPDVEKESTDILVVSEEKAAEDAADELPEEKKEVALELDSNEIQSPHEEISIDREDKAFVNTLLTSPPTNMSFIKHNHPNVVPRRNRRHSAAKTFLYITIGVATVLVSVILFLYFQSKEVKNIIPIVVESVPQIVEEQEAVSDSIAEDYVQKEALPTTISAVSPVQNVTPQYMDTVIIESGSRLTLIAQKYYGHKLFWVYLYLANKDAIADPNNVPIGTSVLIPIPQKYDIDAKNQASLDKAAALQTQILNKE